MARSRHPLSIAIRRKCYECMGGDMDSMKETSVWDEVDDCTAVNCPLFPYRDGKPTIKKAPLTEAQREASRVNLEKGRALRSQHARQGEHGGVSTAPVPKGLKDWRA